MIALLFALCCAALVAAQTRSLTLDAYPTRFTLNSGSMCQAELRVPPGTPSIHIYSNVQGALSANYDVDIFGSFDGAPARDAGLQIDDGSVFGDSSARVPVPPSCAAGCTFYIGLMPKCKACPLGRGKTFDSLISATPVDANGNRRMLLKLNQKSAKQEIPDGGWLFLDFVVTGPGNFFQDLKKLVDDLTATNKYKVRFTVDKDVTSVADSIKVYLRKNSEPIDRLTQAVKRGVPTPGDPDTVELGSDDFFKSKFETELAVGFYTIGIHVVDARLSFAHFSVLYGQFEEDGTIASEKAPPTAPACGTEETGEETGSRDEDGLVCENLSCTECNNRASDGCVFCRSAEQATCTKATSCAAGLSRVPDKAQCCAEKSESCDTCTADPNCSWCTLTSIFNIYSECTEAGSTCATLTSKATECSAKVSNDGGDATAGSGGDNGMSGGDNGMSTASAGDRSGKDVLKDIIDMGGASTTALDEPDASPDQMTDGAMTGGDGEMTDGEGMDDGGNIVGSSGAATCLPTLALIAVAAFWI